MPTISAAPTAGPDPNPFVSGACGESQPSWFGDFASHESHAGLVSASDSESSEAWSEETIMRLHFMLLDDIAKLADRATPIAEKFEILRWIYTDPAHDDAPFSFAACLRLFGRSINPTFGTLDPDDVRTELVEPVRRWILDSLKRYPAWVREAFLENPSWVDELLSRNPQLLNEATRSEVVHGDLFVQSRDSSQRSEEVSRTAEGSHTNHSANGDHHGPDRLRGTR